MNTLSLEQRVRVAAALADGVAMRGVERLTGVARQTVGLFLLTLGDGCALVHAAHMHGLPSDVVEVDEVWAFVGTKESRRDEFHPAEFGDAYTFVALDATHRAVVSHVTDKRTSAAARVFAADVRARVPGKPLLVSDGFIGYRDAIESAFGTKVHYAQNLKTYASDEAGGASRDDVRYSRGRCIASQKIPVFGSPDEGKITTAHVERSNLTTRMWCRRLTRLTSCFSRRLVYLRAALALHFAVYNFVRVHSALRVTPAMQLGVTDHVWSMQELVAASLDALGRPPPAAPPPVPPTPGLEAGARARSARKRAERRASKPPVREPGTPTETSRDEADETNATADPPWTVAVRDTFPVPPDPKSDFRWMW